MSKTSEFFKELIENQDRIALEDPFGSLSYQELLERAFKLAYLLEQDIQRGDRVAVLMEPGRDFLSSMLGVWLAGGIFVPICSQYPAEEISYTLMDSETSVLLYQAPFEEILVKACLGMDISKKCIDSELVEKTIIEESFNPQLPELLEPCYILYTSGTTSKPKGVLHSFFSFEAQLKMMEKLWKWRSNDSILALLPLHHTHGLVNIVSTCLWSGAKLIFIDSHQRKNLWGLFEKRILTLLMAVPTIYYKLIEQWKAQDSKAQAEMSASLKEIRLMISGSAALPLPVFKSWQEISGKALLERYGMTEIGMALSNPYKGERRMGTVGQPFPGVKISLRDKSLNEVKEGAGEIFVKSPSMFKEYWKKPKATEESFHESWFKTGDIAVFEEGYYRILGRQSVDIIKSGGYKISALEIENVLLGHEKISECAVVGISDPKWGERVAALLVSQSDLADLELKEWLSSRLAAYKIPSLLKRSSSLPRNVMGKITKNEVKEIFGES